MRGVAILNMGGPAGESGVEPFLRALFSDPRILPLPRRPRSLLARTIARRRAPGAIRRYRLVGGRSPIHEESERQAAAVGDALGDGWLVRHAFRYTAPRARDVLCEMKGAGVRQVVMLPGYPQRSFSTWDSSVEDFEAAARAEAMSTSCVGPYPDDAGWIRALSRVTDEALWEAGRDAHVVMTAHGVPERNVRRGDPYVGHVHRTARALARSLGPVPWHLAFQSRVGPVRWVGPHLESVVEDLARAGVQSLVVVPVSFVTEHLETRVELDVEVRQMAEEVGIRHFVRAPVPGVDPDFVRALCRLVNREVERA